MSSCLDALEYLCLLMVGYATATWEYLISRDIAVLNPNGINYAQDALHQFCDFFLGAFKCTKTSERDQERLYKSRKTVLQAAVSALKISLGHPEIHKKNFSHFGSIISSAWIEPPELKYFISALGNVAASLYNTGQLKQASAVLKLRCTTVKLLCKMYLEKQNGSHSDNLSDDEIRTVIVDAFEICALIVNVLHKCHASNVYKITVKCLVELSAGDDMFPNLSGSLALVKQWVKMLCKDFENVDDLEKVPYLYSLLLSHCSTLSKKTLGRILEQELLAYGLMEARNPDLCQKMQVKVIDTLLNDVLATAEHYVERSRILIQKARTLRAHGMKGLNDCIKCLREAIFVLKEISSNLSMRNAPIYNQLAHVYILAAQCTQEANQNCEGCWELQFGICKLIFKIFECENAPVEKCLAMLWSERRINHSLCSSPINEDSIMEISRHFDSHANSFEFWTTCLKDDPSFLLAFIQKFSLSDSILPEVKLCPERDFGSIAVDEVKRTASSLISNVNHSQKPLSSQSASIAGYLYYDLAERLLSGGQLFEALSHARVALWLRKKLMQRKFFYSFEHKFAEAARLADANQNQQDTVCLEIIGSVATEIWPDTNKSSGLKNYILTPWSILRCYLESILQVGIINESVGNGAEAVVLFLTGKGISTMQDLPIFQIAFTSLLVCLEIIGSVATEIWPDTNKSSGLKNYILTPWSILRCYLESILQVGIINESVGNGAEAVVLFLTGKGISTMQDLPIFQIAFTSLLVCLEIIGSVATEIWPDTNKSSGLKNYILTPWSILRCYLESILQVGIINESVGNGAEAVVLFLTGKGISTMQDLPIFQIAFTSLLGQLYREKQFLDLAEHELNSARNLLHKYDMIISCKRCKLAFDVFIDMQFGDLSRNRSEDGDPIQLSSCALQVYRKALDKLNHDELASSLNCHRKAETCIVNMQDAHYGGLNGGKIPSTPGEVRLPACNICSSPNGDVHHAKQLRQGNMNNKGLSLNRGTRKSSRISSKCTAKEQDLNAELKQKTHFSKKTTHNKSAKVTDRGDINEVRIADNDVCSDTLGRKNSQSKVKGNSTDSGCNEECTCNTIKCWRCFLIKSMMDGTMQNIIYLKWECHRRRLVMRLLLKIAKCQQNKAHGVHDQFCQCISVMFNQHPTSHSNSVVSDFYLIELAGGDDSRDIFPVEKALLLYNMSWFFLKERLSENSRMNCCIVSRIQTCDVVPWLLKAFILSRELPLLFQKVSKLLSFIYLMSKVDGPISVPSDSLLSTSHWAAFFHQASVGTCVPCQYLACLKDKARFPNVSEDPCSIMLDKVIKASNVVRFAPDRLEHLEEFVREFFQSLPSVPVICISFLERDYANLIGENTLLPCVFPVRMLFSRLNAARQPIAILLPVDRILDVDASEVELESGKEWECPWSSSIIDYVAPVFKQLLKAISPNMAYTGTDTKTERIKWWSQKYCLNDCLNQLLKFMEDSWLGPWACLLLGEHSNPDNQSKIITKLTKELKLQCKAEANDSLVSAILGGSKCIADMEACIAQLLLYGGYFGISKACPEGRRSLPDSIYRLLQEASAEIDEQSNREPVILVLDSDVQMLPWENLPTLRRHEVYRMPSVGSISLTLRRCSYYKKHSRGAGFPLVNSSDAYYLLNPSGDLGSTQVEFEQWFRNQNWEGEAGKAPSAAELALALKNHDLFLYFGHGSGMQYIPSNEIEKLSKCAATLLMGCSSGTLTYKGCYAPRGAPLSYLFAGSPVVVANLWDVTDKDIDRFGKAMLKSWLEEDKCTWCDRLDIEIDAPKSRRKASKLSDEGRCEVCGSKRMASFMSQARDACKLPFLIGAAPVCYGVPTLIMKHA